jgi:hypothetical protein
MSEDASVNLLPALDSADDPPPNVSPTENFFVESDRTLLSLVVLSIGLCDDDGSATLDPNLPPWKNMNANMIKPKVDDLKAECIRRWCAFIRHEQDANKAKEPSNKYWDRKKLLKYLCDHPISAASEVAFLRAEISKRKETAAAAMEEAAAEKRLLDAADASAKKYKSWSGKLPYLRLIHTIVDNDNIKRAYIHRNDIPSGRMAVENRNTAEAKAANVWQMVADKWNDVTFTPVTESVPDLFRDHFAASETIPHHMVASFIPPTADKAKERFESMMTILKRIIPKWEKSGQGDEGHHGDDDDNNPIKHQEGNTDMLDDDNEDIISDDNDEEGVVMNKKPKWGEMKGRSRCALSMRQEFFQHSNSYVLYLWHIIAKHDLIGTSMSMLADSVGSLDGARGIPTAIRKTNYDNEISVNYAINGSDSRSVGSNSATSKFSHENYEDMLSSSIRDHGTNVMQFAKIKAEEGAKNRAHAEGKEKRKRADVVDQQILSLRAEKRQLIIRLSSMENGSNPAAENAISSSIEEINEDIRKKQLQLAELVEMPTPIKSNRTPEDK